MAYQMDALRMLFHHFKQGSLPPRQLMLEGRETLDTRVDINHRDIGSRVSLNDHLFQVFHVLATAENAGDEDHRFVTCGEVWCPAEE